MRWKSSQGAGREFREVFVARMRAWGGRRAWEESAGEVGFEGTTSFFLFLVEKGDK